MNILALDTATVTGWALSRGAAISSGVWNCSIRTKATKHDPADHPGLRFSSFADLFRQTTHAVKLDLVVYERIVGGARAGGNVSLIQKGLEALVLMSAYQQGVPCWSFAPATIKKWAIGSGKLTHESKEVVLAAARSQFGARVRDDNEADALFILDLALAITFKYRVASQPSDQLLTDLANRVIDAKWAK